MEALTPNTAAFLDSLSFDAIKPESDIVSMPPSTFFPIPGRDTPEDSSPDSQPAKHADTSRVNLSDDSDADLGPGASHKRKASVGNVEHDEDDGDGEWIHPVIAPTDFRFAVGQRSSRR